MRDFRLHIGKHSFWEVRRRNPGCRETEHWKKLLMRRCLLTRTQQTGKWNRLKKRMTIHSKCRRRFTFCTAFLMRWLFAKREFLKLIFQTGSAQPRGAILREKRISNSPQEGRSRKKSEI